MLQTARFRLLLLATILMPAGAAAQTSVITLDSLLNVTVSAAARYAQTAREAAASVSIVTSEDIERYGYRTLDDVLESVRGFYLSGDRNYLYVGVRGFGRPTDYNNRIVVLLDGHPLNETYYNGLSVMGAGLGLDMHAVDRIEVVRGPASSLYGTNAMLAVVNVVTRPGLALDGGRVAVDAGTAGRVSGRAVFGRRLGEFDVRASAAGGRTGGEDLYFPEFDDPATLNGRAIGMDWEKWAHGAAALSWRGWFAQLYVARRDKGVPTAPWGSTFGDTRAQTHDAQAAFQLRSELPLTPALQLVTRTHLNTYRYHGWYPADVLYEDRNIGWWGGIESQLIWDVAANHRVTVGMDWTRTAQAEYIAWSPFGVSFQDDFPFSTWSLYVLDDLQLNERLSILVGARLDRHSVAPEALSPRAALIYRPFGESVAKLLYGEAFRAPSVYEQNFFADGFRRNPDIGPERVRTVEFILEQRLTGALYGVATAFDTRVRDLIDTAIDPVDSLAFFTNIGQAHAQGFELELNGRFDRGLSGYASWGYTRAHDQTNDDRLTNSPVHSAKLGVSAAARWLGTAAAELRYEDGRATMQQTRTDQALLAHLHYASPAWHGLRLALGVHNALDVQFNVPAGAEHVQSMIPQPGRTMRLGAEYRFH